MRRRKITIRITIINSNNEFKANRSTARMKINKELNNSKRDRTKKTRSSRRRSRTATNISSNIRRIDTRKNIRTHGDTIPSKERRLHNITRNNCRM